MKYYENPLSFGFDPSKSSSWKTRVLSPFVYIIDRISGLKKVSDIYLSAVKKSEEANDIIKQVLRGLQVDYDVVSGSLERIPKEGPVILVANHPFGGVEGVILVDLLRSIRPDIKILANFLLHRIERLREFFLFVDPFGRSGSSRRNVGPLRETLQWLQSGGVLGMFPSGTVSHLHVSQGSVTDPAWNPSIARLVRHSGATVVPVFFNGNNGPLFQVAGLIHPLLRTLLLPRALLNKAGKTIELCIGNPIENQRLKSFETDEEMLAYLRLRTYILGCGGNEGTGSFLKKNWVVLKRKRTLDPLVPAEPTEVLEKEVSRLGEAHRLLQSGDNTVYCARMKEIPHIVREIGRLRELTFRTVEEGTGKKIDLDRFDNYYHHLFIWNQVRKEVVGAYRVAQTEPVLRRYGIKGLYTNTLFKYSEPLLEQMGPALELGRSFVRPEYQKNYSSLYLLWQGIGRFIVRDPRYRVLFGPVSINSEYDSLSRQLIIAFLEANRSLPELSRLIKPRNPLPKIPLPGHHSEGAGSYVVRDLKEISELLVEMEAKQTRVPVLLRQYLKLGGKLLGFNVDAGFGDVLDGLIYVDLDDTDPKLLERYLGSEGAKEFRAYTDGVRENTPFYL